MELVLVVALSLFAITHLDTLLVLVAFCTDDQYSLAEIFVGHYLGFSIGLLGAIAGAKLARHAVEEWTFLLGFVPLTLGLWGFYRRRSTTQTATGAPVADPARRISIVTTAGIGLSGENIAIFVPFFVTLNWVELVIVSIVYVVAAAIVFGIAVVLGRRTADPLLPDWLDSIGVPLVLTLVGLYVLAAGWVAG